MKIELIPWTTDLKGDLIRVCNHVDRTYLTNRLPNPYTEADADWWLSYVSEHEGRDGLFRAVAADGEIVGNITVEGKSDVFCRDAELGYTLMTERRSRGIMTEAARQMCPLAFERLNIARITSMVYAPNIASRRVLEKAGFVREGLMKNAVWKNGRLYDLLIYGLMKQRDEIE